MGSFGLAASPAPGLVLARLSLALKRLPSMQANGWRWRDLFRTLEALRANRLRGAHAALDSAVRGA